MLGRPHAPVAGSTSEKSSEAAQLFLEENASFCDKTPDKKKSGKDESFTRINSSFILSLKSYKSPN